MRWLGHIFRMPEERLLRRTVLEAAGDGPTYPTGSLMMDMNGVKITVATTHGSKTVNFYYGCRGAIASKVRPRIDQLASTIDRQLDTARWIGKPAAPGKARQATH